VPRDDWTRRLHNPKVWDDGWDDGRDGDAMRLINRVQNLDIASMPVGSVGRVGRKCRVDRPTLPAPEEVTSGQARR
jgi:hypothetical protein